MSTAEVMDRGMTCLIRGLGIVDTERFIATLSQEDFDYTKWQRERFDDVPADDFFDAAIQYEKEHPFKYEEN